MTKLQAIWLRLIGNLWKSVKHTDIKVDSNSNPKFDLHRHVVIVNQGISGYIKGVATLESMYYSYGINTIADRWSKDLNCSKEDIKNNYIYIVEFDREIDVTFDRYKLSKDVTAKPVLSKYTTVSQLGLVDYDTYWNEMERM
jgi:hypothetical protein